MSVFTTVTVAQLRDWLRGYAVGALREMRGILSGIENTNYFVTTDAGSYVLTLFERLQPAQLHWYLNLMAHLSAQGIACPRPIAGLTGNLLGELNDKPAALVTRLPGAPVLDPDAGHCEAVGHALAGLHLAGLSYSQPLDNLRGAPWWSAVAPRLEIHLDASEAALLRAEIDFQSSQRSAHLPRGVVHADLFRDNVLWEGAGIGGIIDFYFACTDALVYDVAITLNDWCVRPDATLDLERARALLDGYQRVRPLTGSERDSLPVMLRAGALRFWVSRLYDYHLPRPGELTHAHDPERFRLILLNHSQSDPAIAASLC